MAFVFLDLESWKLKVWVWRFDFWGSEINSELTLGLAFGVDLISSRILSLGFRFLHSVGQEERATSEEGLYSYERPAEAFIQGKLKPIPGGCNLTRFPYC